MSNFGSLEIESSIAPSFLDKLNVWLRAFTTRF
jgi:hypothetical protein